MNNVLVYPSKSELGKEIYDALKYSKDIELFEYANIEHNGIDLNSNINKEQFMEELNSFIVSSTLVIPSISESIRLFISSLIRLSKLVE